MESLLIIAPVFNESGNISGFLDALEELSTRQVLAGVLLVDDGSTDDSVERITQRASAFSAPVKLVCLSRNFGHQNACLAGLAEGAKWAEALGVEWVGLIDSDLQDNPAHFVELMAHHVNHDVVYAVRKKRNDGLIRKVFAPLFYRFLSRCASFYIPVNAGTFSVIRRELAAKIVEIADVDPYVPGLRAFVGFRQKGVPLERSDRHKGRSHVGMLGLVLLSLRATILYTNAIHNFILYSGMIVFLTSIALAAFLGLTQVLGLSTPGGEWKTWLLLSTTFGAQMFFLGAIGHMINRVKANTSKQPPFLARQVLSFGGSKPQGNA
jgi:dolichol-phosphate mannosyltransferase